MPTAHKAAPLPAGWSRAGSPLAFDKRQCAKIAPAVKIPIIA
jgi:hypothetical protein